ncbi:MAG TPA: ABC transporter permease [Steroidobacteraceae bacterium]|nr:ABC transporter permease [Steroidobacteraceae bacterium]
MKLLTHFGRLTALGLREIPHRPGSSLVIVTGIAGVVAVLIPVFAMYQGVQATIRNDGSPERAIVLSRDATDEYNSTLSREAVSIIGTAPGIRRFGDTGALVSAEIVLAAPVSRKHDHSDVNVTFRGVSPDYFALRPELKLVAGRMFRTGTQELLVGAAARAQFEGLQLGELVRLQEGDWRIVGVFAGGNGARNSEVIADAQTVMSAYKLDGFNSMTIALDSAGSLPLVRNALRREGRIAVSVWSEPDYLKLASKSTDPMLRLAAYTIGTIMSLGALFAALNSMYSASASRAGEIAMLRAIGFLPAAVAAAVLAEAVILALLGAILGIALAYGLFDDLTLSTLGGALFDSQLVYSMRVTPALVGMATALACGLGFLGSLPPALRAARGRITTSLYEI